jgi:TonB family protein
LADYAKAIARDPSYVYSYIDRAKLYHRLGKDELARQDADNAVALPPYDNEEAAKLRAEIYAKLGRPAPPVERVQFAPPQPPGLPTLSPHWIRIPTGQEAADAYPPAAMARGIEGHTNMTCVVTAAGTLISCRITEETPPGAGFGEAALLLADKFVMSPKTDGGRPVQGARVAVPIAWKLH